jgi:formylmethanofuran dehydrogenase subunit B
MKQAAGAVKARVLDCPRKALGAVLGLLRVFVAGHPAAERIAVAQAGGIATRTLRELAAKMRAAKYCVAVWSAADLDFAHAELTVQRIVELVKDLNVTTRSAGLPLGGNDGDLTMNQVHLWQSAYALRSDFGGGEPDYDPFHNGAARLLDRGEADALMWISSFSAARLPPRTDVPTIVLGRADMKLTREPAVCIPVGVPGVDHAGHVARSDKVVTMRLGRLRESVLPPVAEVLAQIEAAL